MTKRAAGPKKESASEVRNIKITLEYDGGSFFGFQKQGSHPTIQAALENAMSRLFNREMKIKAASGRTDTGVHALGQVVNFYCVSPLALWKIQAALNALLPEAVAVVDIEEEAADFHARYSAKSKIYEYRIWNSPFRAPLRGKMAWHVSDPLDLTEMRRGMKFFLGKHDFKAFAAADPAKKRPQDTVRNILALDLKTSDKLLRMRVQADGFLYHMVRNIAGTLAEIGLGKKKASDIPQILRSKDRGKAGRMAPACGLILAEVLY